MSTFTPNYNLEKPDNTDDFKDFRQSYNDNMDIIDQNLGGGGGSTVSWSQLQVTGDQLATITVSGITQNVYAPNSQTFTVAVSRANIESGETYPTIFGKIKKWFADLKAVAFSGSYNDLSNTPTKVSDFTNDSGFVTSTVNNLAYYYLKSETYTQAQVDALIGAISTISIEVVQSLPTQDIKTNTIYLVPKQTVGTQNVYDEYIYVNNAWELIGDTEIDLSNYVTTTDLATALQDYVTSTGLSTILANYYTSSQIDTLLGGKVNDVEVNGTSVVNGQGVAEVTVPTKTSDLNNDSGYLTDSDVSVTQVVSSGTKIATIDVKGTSTDLYAPASGGGSVNDVTVNGSSVVNAQGVAEVTAVQDNPTFTEAQTRANIASGESFATILGKIKKWFSDLASMFVSKTGDTMTGQLSIKQSNSTTSHIDSALSLGNNIPNGTTGCTYGKLRLWGDGAYRTDLLATLSTANRNIYFPDATGTVALTSDILAEFKGIMGDDIASLDFNDYTTNGWYENTGTNRTGTANAPNTEDNGYLLVVSKSRTVYQYWYSTYKSLGTMVRARKNGTWGSWGTVALTSQIPDISTKVTKSGDTMTGKLTIDAAYSTPLAINRTNNAGKCYLAFGNSNGTKGYFAVGDDKLPYFQPQGGSDKRIALLDEIPDVSSYSYHVYKTTSGNKRYNITMQSVGMMIISCSQAGESNIRVVIANANGIINIYSNGSGYTISNSYIETSLQNVYIDIMATVPITVS